MFKTLDMVLSGDATPEMVEQVCYLSEQMIKDDKNSIEVEKARMFLEVEKESRMSIATNRLSSMIEGVEGYESSREAS